MNSRFLVSLFLPVVLLALPQRVGAQATILPPQPIVPWEILFSISPPEHFSLAWPPFRDGDVASNRGYVVAREWQLVQPFGPPPTMAFAPVDYGLDALSELRCYPAAKTFRPALLFSVKNEKGFYSSRLKTHISHGDLLSVGRTLLDPAVDLANVPCSIVARNSDLVGKFGMMPPVADMGLDAVYIPYYVPLTNSLWPSEIWFSTNRGWWDEKLSRQISDGDLLSNRGYVVATNAQLLRNFFPNHKTPPELGLDAVYVPRYRPWCNSALPPEIWFSVTKSYDFDDEATGVHIQISDGDLLSNRGYVVAANAELLKMFPNLTDGPILANYGLDAVSVRGRNLIASFPPGPTVSKVAGNVIRLVFDGAVEMPATSALSVGSQAAPAGPMRPSNLAGATFDVSLAITNTPNDTLVLTERGAALADTGPCLVQPSEDMEVEPFTLSLTKLVGDVSSDGYVNVGDLQQLVATWGKPKTEAGFNTYADLNNDDFVNVGDLQLLVANWGR